jgi:hypothetical protein
MMLEVIMVTEAGSPTIDVDNEHRQRVRYPQVTKAYCQRGAGELDQFWWMGRTRDISGGGVGLFLPYSFAPGTELTIELESAGRTFAHTAHARVIHSQRQPSGNWLIGCAFAQELSPLEVTELL